MKNFKLLKNQFNQMTTKGKAVTALCLIIGIIIVLEIIA